MTEYLNKDINGPDAEVAPPDVDETLATLEELGWPQAGVTPLEPAEAQDANAFAVTTGVRRDQRRDHAERPGDLGEPVALAAAPDCPERDDCKLGLE